MRISDWSSDVCSSDLHIVAPRAVANRIAIAQQPHREALVIMAALADLLTLVADRPRDTVDRARQDRVHAPAARMSQLEIPGIAERLDIRPPRQEVGRQGRPTHPAARSLDEPPRRRPPTHTDPPHPR